MARKHWRVPPGPKRIPERVVSVIETLMAGPDSRLRCPVSGSSLLLLLLLLGR
jgi:hypothetical protein